MTYDQRAPSFERNSSSEESPDMMSAADNHHPDSAGAAQAAPMAIDQASTETIANCHRFWSVIKSNDMMEDVLKEIKNKISILQRQSQFELRSEGKLIYF